MANNKTNILSGDLLNRLVEVLCGDCERNINFNFTVNKHLRKIFVLKLNVKRCF